MESLKDNPITAIDKTTMAPVMIGYSDIKVLVFAALYKPVTTFEPVASLFNFLYTRQHDLIGQILGGGFIYHREPFCASSLPSWAYPSEAQDAIMCSDKRYPVSHRNLVTLRLLLTRLGSLMELSQISKKVLRS